MADKKKMSVEDILAACRKGGAGAAAAPSQSSAQASEADSSAAPAAPAESPAESAAPAKPAAAAPKVKPGAMSVNDILAAARAGKGAAAAPAPATSKADSAKPAATKAVAPKAAAAKESPAKSPVKPAAEKPVAAAKVPAVDTASILAAARGVGKPGPVSKSELKEKLPEPTGKKKLEVPPMPAKPAYAQSKPVAAAPAETRRGFFASASSMVVGSSMALGFASLAVTNLMWVLGLARFMFPNILTEPPTRFKVGFPDTLAPGQVDERFKAAFGVWIVRHEYEGQSQIFALKTVCTHLGCTPNWLESEQKFKCPCHGSGFYKEGINFEGPAPRPLERYAIRVADDGQLEVDKSRVFHEETGQWRDPGSFVPA